MKKVLLASIMSILSLGVMISCSDDDDPAYEALEYGENGYGDPLHLAQDSLAVKSSVFPQEIR